MYSTTNLQVCLLLIYSGAMPFTPEVDAVGEIITEVPLPLDKPLDLVLHGLPPYYFRMLDNLGRCLVQGLLSDLVYSSGPIQERDTVVLPPLGGFIDELFHRSYQ